METNRKGRILQNKQIRTRDEFCLFFFFKKNVEDFDKQQHVTFKEFLEWNK